MATIDNKKPKPKNEIRIGLVLYGGVSLAIYIYGVVLEFLRVVRAWELEHNVYSDILEKTDSKIVVDIISGASAGGINGVLLAKALSNGLSTESFGMLRSLWLEAADSSSLLKPGRPEMAALLDERFFEDRLLAELNQMDAEVENAKENGKSLEPSVSALDLFISSTDLNGRIVSGRELGETVFRHPIESKEYRRMFHFKFRKKGFNDSDPDLGNPKNDFSKDKNDTLLKICRATSAFPGALRPVKLKKGKEVVESLLKPEDDQTVFLTDGGVLNNKPFSDTIAAIFRRNPFSKVDRILFYVEPDPETYVKQETTRDEPGFWEIIIKSTVGIPSYQSITNDIRNIKDRNRRILEFKNILDRTEKLVKNATDPKNGKLITGLDSEEYRNFLEGQTLFQGYQELKVSKLNARLQELFLERNLGFDNLHTDTSINIKRAFEKAFEKLSEEPEKQKKLKDVLEAFDAPYRVRRLFRLTEVTELLYQTQNLTEANRRKIDIFMEKISALLERAFDIEWRTWNNSNEQSRSWFEEPLNKLKQEIMSLKDNLNSDLLESEFSSLQEHMIHYSGPGFEGLQKEFDELSKKGKALAEEIDKFVGTLKLQSDHPLADFPPFEKIYTQFEFRDMFIYPIEVIGNLGERDPIEIVRISPKDATHICSDAGKKLAGDTLFHFGGFLKKKWRENDIMWGRLDAAELIIRTLCQKGSGNVDESKYINEVLRDILAEDNEESKKAVEPGVNYKRYMQEKYNIGAEDLKDIDTGSMFRLILDTLLSLRDMLKYDLQHGGKASKVIGFLDTWLSRALNLVSVPAILLVRALFDKDSFIQTIFSLIILGLGTWGGITLVLFAVGKVLSLPWLKIEPSIAGIALGTLIFTSLFGLLFIKYRGDRKPRGQKS
ncbi:patatin-like protein [Chloroflexota bacterium]